MTTFLLVAGGLILLFVGGEALVRGAVAVSLRLGITPLVVGVTVVGFGTSAPELATSLEAVLSGAPGLALGNVVGSNIANVLLILGIAALISPLTCPPRTALRDGALMLAAGLLFAGLALGGVIGRAEGVVLVLALAAYLVFVWRSERRKAARHRTDETARRPEPGGWRVARDVALLLVGLAAVIGGGRLLVIGAVDLAETLGVSDTLIGLTVVALGTSLPELATSIAAALRRQPELAYGNVVGSNVFNLLGIAGVTAATAPVAVSPELLSFDLPVAIIAMGAMALLAASGGRVSRTEGAALLACYFGYVALIVF